MKNLKLIFAICLFTVWFTPAQAFQVILDDTGTNATHILNLDFGGTLYDVTFVQTIAANGQPCPNYPCDLFEGDESGAEAAALVIVDALNEDVLIGGSGNTAAVSVGPEVFGQPFDAVLVPWEYDTSGCFNAGGTSGTCSASGTLDAGVAGSWFFLPGINESLDISTQNFARFSPGGSVAIPVPPAAWLFGSALGLLGWVRRRTRNAAGAGDSNGPHMV
jgi:hypothetical protein